MPIGQPCPFGSDSISLLLVSDMHSCCLTLDYTILRNINNKHHHLSHSLAAHC